MEIIDKYAKQLNPVQKNIAAGVISAIILIITITVASSTAGNQYHSGDPFELEKTWFVWIVGLGALGYVLTRIYGRESMPQQIKVELIKGAFLRIYTL